MSENKTRNKHGDTYTLLYFNINEILTVTPCTTEPCLNNGTCTVVEESYVCVCPDTYGGTTCDGQYITFYILYLFKLKNTYRVWL